MKPPIIEIDDFSGGMALNDRTGKSNQFYIGKGVDFESHPGKLAAGINYSKMSLGGTTDLTVEFPWMVLTERDDEFWIGGDDTKIYNRSASSTITERHDDANAGGVRGMAEYNQYLYWAGSTTVGRKDLDQAVGAGFTDSWQTGLTSADHHPMLVSDDAKLYIAHGQYLAQWDDTTWTAQKLDLADNWVIRALAPFGYSFIAIGANLGSRGKIFLWNRTDTSWSDEISIPDSKVQALIFSAGYLWIWTQKALYVVPEASRRATRMMQFKAEDPETSFEIYPGAVAAREGNIYFGLSTTANDASKTNPTGIYSFPANPNDFKVNIPFRINDKNEFYKGLGIDIVSTGEKTIFHSYTDETNDALYRENNKPSDSNNYGGSNQIETFKYEAPKNKKMLTEAFGVRIDPFVSGSGDIDLEYRKDEESAWTSLFATFQTVDATEKIVYLQLEANTLQLRLTTTGSASEVSRNFIKSIFVTGELIDRT